MAKFNTLCVKCSSKKPPRVHHCSQCERCVFRMDHHCPFVANCIGIANIKFFILLLLYTLIICTMSFIQVALKMGLALHNYQQKAGLWDEIVLGMYSLTILLGLFGGLFSIGLLCRTYSSIKTGRSPIGKKNKFEEWEFEVSLSKKLRDIY